MACGEAPAWLDWTKPVGGRGFSWATSSNSPTLAPARPNINGRGRLQWGDIFTSTVDANSMRVLPSAIGTVFRSTSTSPTCASTTRPAPAYWSAATPSI
eukprot:scaffold2313_cov100-Isochrysis_galbana.AAC.7